MSATVSAAGYRLAMPAGWTRLTVGDGSEVARDRFVQSRVRRLSGRDRVLAERRLTSVVDRTIAEAQSAGALDLYFYSRVVRRIPVQMNFSVGVVFLGLPVDEMTDDVLVEIAGVENGETRVEELDGQRAVRVSSVREQNVTQLRADAERLFSGVDDESDIDPAYDAQVEGAIAEFEENGVTTRSVRVSYLLDIPDAPGAYLLAAFDAPEGALTEAMVFHFDMIMSTFRWER